MSTMGAVEEGLKDLSRTAELVGFALERANRADGKPEQELLIERAKHAASERVQAMNALLEAIHEHAATQYQAGLDIGRESAVR